MKDHFILASKNIRRRGIRSWLTLIGIFIGIAAVVSLITLGNGLRAAALSQFGTESTKIISIQAGGLNSFGPPGSFAVNKLTKDDVDAIQNLGLIEIAVGRQIKSGKLEYNDKVIFGYAVSIPEGEKGDFVYEEMGLEKLEGNLLDGGDYGKVVLGYNFFIDKVGLEKEVTVGKNVKIQDKNFKVIGITKKKGSFLLDNVVYMTEKDMEDLFETNGYVDIIAAKVKDKDLMSKAKEDVEDLLRKRRNVKKGQEDFEVSTPEATLATVNSILLGIQIFVVLIALISIAVGSIGIINTMTTSVLERRKEIGIMKAIGAKNSDVFLQFFFEAGLLGLIGGIIGILLGIGLGIIGINAINDFTGSTVAPQISFTLISLSLLGSFLIGSIAGVVPALRAAHQNPVEALRE
jgi:putative ABC transport system permease protein